MTEEEVRRRFWKRVIVALVTVFVVLPILTVARIAIFRYKNQKTAPAETIVPNLKGLDLKIAESRARHAQLNPASNASTMGHKGTSGHNRRPNTRAGRVSARRYNRQFGFVH